MSGPGNIQTTPPNAPSPIQAVGQATQNLATNITKPGYNPTFSNITPMPTIGAGGGKGGQPTVQPIAQGQTLNTNQLITPNGQPAPTGGVVAKPYIPTPFQGGVPTNINQAAAQSIRGAMQGTSEAMGYQPQMVGTSALTPMVGTNTLARTNMAAYMNPYESQVVGSALGDIERQRKLQEQQTSTAAQRAGAFGGSRHGVAQAETNRAFAEQAAQTAAGLRQSGYTQAQGMAQADLSRQLQAQGMNQSAAQQTAQRMLNAQIANQQAGLAGMQQRLGASNQLGQLGNLGFGMGQTISQNMLQQGLMQQQMNQALIDAAQQRYGQYTGYPTQGIGLLSSAIGQSPTPQTTTTNNQKGLFDYATLAAMTYAGMNR